MTPPGIDIALPAVYDVAWSVLALATLVLFIVAFIKWTKVDFGPGKSGLGWLVVMVIFPIIGSIAFLVQSRTMPTRVKASQAS